MTFISHYKPYLILPTLIEQLTWGGDYITKFKGFEKNQILINKKIGQSYELSGSSKLLINNNSIDDPYMLVSNNQISTSADIKHKCMNLDDFVMKDPQSILGDNVFEKHGKMPLLIKLNHSSGNSYQIHIKPGIKHSFWKPKPESWYCFEKGLITFGLKKDISIKNYKNVCKSIEKKIQELSRKVIDKRISVEKARENARKFIETNNPLQFVNQCDVKPNMIIDLSQGGIHHSWQTYPNNNIVSNVMYEVQLDVADNVSTIRSFDQGKIKDDGSIREIQIDDYFHFIDTQKDHNNISYAIKQKNVEKLISTHYYCLDQVRLTKRKSYAIENSFVHIFSKEGSLIVETNEGSIKLTKGNSCFIPYAAKSYILKPISSKVEILKTYIA